MNLIKVFEDDNFIIDYDKDNKRYRVSYFENHHFKDECWFDAYEENPYIIEIKRKLSPSEIESIFGSTNIGVLDCSDMSDEEVDRIVDELNSIGCTSFQLTPEETRNLLEKTELESTIDDWKRLGYTDEEAEKLVEASKIYQ